MSDADELRAGIDVAINLEERAMANLTSLERTLEELQGQLILLAIGSRNPRSRSAMQMTERASNDLNQVVFDLLEVRTALNEWREAP